MLAVPLPGLAEGLTRCGLLYRRLQRNVRLLRLLYELWLLLDGLLCELRLLLDGLLCELRLLLDRLLCELRLLRCQSCRVLNGLCRYVLA